MDNKLYVNGKCLGEIKEIPTLTIGYDWGDTEFSTFQYPTSMSFTLKFTKPVSKHLHYAKQSKKFRTRKKHINKFIELTGWWRV